MAFEAAAINWSAGRQNETPSFICVPPRQIGEFVSDQTRQGCLNARRTNATRWRLDGEQFLEGRQSIFDVLKHDLRSHAVASAIRHSGRRGVRSNGTAARPSDDVSS